MEVPLRYKKTLDDVSRRVQQAVLGHRGHRDDPLYRTRRLMTRGWERLTDRQRDKLLLGLAQGDPDGEVSATIVGKELVREMYAAKSYPAARRPLVRFYEHVAQAEVPELNRLARTLSAWESEVLNYHVTHISNGPSEARNLATEKARRIGHGFQQLRQLPAASLAPLRSSMEHSGNCTNQGPSPTARRVDPLIPSHPVDVFETGRQSGPGGQEARPAQRRSRFSQDRSACPPARSARSRRVLVKTTA